MSDHLGTFCIKELKSDIFCGYLYFFCFVAKIELSCSLCFFITIILPEFSLATFEELFSLFDN